MLLQFGVEDVVAGLGLSLADWEIQRYTEKKPRDIAKAYSRLGDVLHKTVFNKRVEYNLELILAEAAEVSNVELVLGAILDTAPDIVLTQFRLRQIPDDVPSLSLTLHKHVDTGADAKSHIPRIYTVTLAGPYLNGIQSSEALSNDPLPDVLKSVEIAGSINHVDKLSRSGGFLTGFSNKGILRETLEFHDDADITPTYNSGWTEEDDTPTDQANTGYAGRTVIVFKDLAGATP